MPTESSEEVYTGEPLAYTGRQTGLVFSAVACEDTGEGPVTHFNPLDTPSFPEPAPADPFPDPIFHTCLARVTDRSRDLVDVDGSSGLKNEYSRVQSFNADGSRFLIRSIDAFWYLYDAETLAPLAQLPLLGDPRWDPNDPDLIYHVDETRLMAYRISTYEQKLVHDFSEDFPGRSVTAVWTRYEGSPSFDGRYWGMMAQDDNWQVFAFLVYDMEKGAVISRRELGKAYDIDSVTISPLGDYFLAYFDNYCEPGTSGSDQAPCGLMVYDRELKSGRSLLRIVGHSDTALDASGRQVLVFQDIDTDFISMLDLETGAVTQLYPIDFSRSPTGLHFSGRAEDAPGWAIVSTYSGAHPAATWMDDSVFAIELKPDGRIVRLAHTHSIVDENQEHDYWAEPHASPSRDLTRILFTSNWGRSGSGEVETFMIVLPAGWFRASP